MKFGKTLLANQIPEWSRNYISYKSVKMAIKAASTHLPPPEEEVTGKKKKKKTSKTSAW
jgi:glycerophosphodiester phosphodiesterase